MTIPFRIIIGKALSSQEHSKLEEEVNAVFRLIDTTYNNWNINSEISKINRAPSGIPIPISNELVMFLASVNQLYSISGGRFDPTMGTLKTVWLLYLKQNLLPPPELLESYRNAITWGNISIDFANQTITKKNSLVQIDLCGTIKGYAVDCILETCKQVSKDNYVEWGGEIKTSGCHPSGRPWRVASSATQNILELSDTAIATSGNYYQQWRVAGKIYTHIIDPSSGIPLEANEQTISSVSVIDPSCAFADAMATVLMTFSSPEEAREWAKKNKILAYINGTSAS
ncbi:apbE family protein [Chlamydia ibidis]|uniref:FAD:protein FMN transferase n=3 Tax=Chlamydia ibidis TaxID=1405396 RepID=S7J6C4_9CHLA|nr:apbE family protein [Chlamydia ibidis]EQM62732.1 apbE family protein [Chlamydia ibidis 10-1398/6]